jgi:hypothetical protein
MEEQIANLDAFPTNSLVNRNCLQLTGFTGAGKPKRYVSAPATSLK